MDDDFMTIVFSGEQQTDRISSSDSARQNGFDRKAIDDAEREAQHFRAFSAV